MKTSKEGKAQFDSVQTDSRSHYLHGTAPREQDRLSRLNDLLNEASLREMGLVGGEKILDLGCGLGQLTRAMARAAGSGARVVGVERSAEQLGEARRQALAAGEENLVELRCGDALSLPLDEDEWGSFDVAHARFLLEHVPDPLAVVRRMVQSVRPGGRIILEDDNHDTMRLYPELPGFGSLWNAYMRTYEDAGNDPYVGHHLVSLLHQAGAMPKRNTWIFFGGCSGNPILDAYVENLIGIVEGAREAILSTTLIDQNFLEEEVRALREWGRRPDAAMWFSLSWAEGSAPTSRP